MKYLNTILLIIVPSVTIGLFFLLGDPLETPLFYVNLGFTCLLELILFGTIIRVSSKPLFNVPNLAASIQIGRYVFLAATIMVVYNVLFYILKIDIHPKWYFGALILTTLIYLVFIIFVIQGGKVQMQQSADVKEKTIQRTNFKDNALALSTDYKRMAISKKKIDYKLLEECKKAINLIGDKISIIPIAKLERNTELIAKINDEINELQIILNQIKETDDTKNNIVQIQILRDNAYGVADKINLINQI
ncbi:MAG: hypothetical protein QM486_06970 [Flavobacteriaceae bacterium]